MCNVNEQRKELLRRVRQLKENADKYLAEECGGTTFMDPAAHRRAKRYADREELLDKLVPTRRCPNCGEVKGGGRSWVVADNQSVAICRSCYCKELNETKRITQTLRKEYEKNPDSPVWDEWLYLFD